MRAPASKSELHEDYCLRLNKYQLLNECITIEGSQSVEFADRPKAGPIGKMPGHPFTVAGPAFCETVSVLRSHIGIGGWCFWGVGCGCDIGAVCFRLLLRSCVFVSERVEIIPNVWCGANFVDADIDMMWQAQYFVRVLRCGSTINCRGRRRGL